MIGATAAGRRAQARGPDRSAARRRAVTVHPGTRRRSRHRGESSSTPTRSWPLRASSPRSPGSGTHVAAIFQLSRVEPIAQQTPIPAPAATVKFDLRADRPDLSLFPRRKWVAATRDAVRDLADGDLGYSDPLGSDGLRAHLASYLARVRGAVAAPEGVLIVAGVTQGLVLLGRELAAHGHDVLAVEDPGSRGLRRVLAGTGLRLVPVPVDRDGLDVAALAATDARAVLCTPAHQVPAVPCCRRHGAVHWCGGRWIATA